MVKRRQLRAFAEHVFAINGFADWWSRIQALPSFKSTPPQ
jgi:glutathione S-transferase